jgi:hypothetical protein
MIMDWKGYPEGAITADTLGLRTARAGGNVYCIASSRVYNVHPKVTSCNNGAQKYEPGVYPIRWELDKWEITQLLLEMINET